MEGPGHPLYLFLQHKGFAKKGCRFCPLRISALLVISLL
jgi:hypothetical protein